MSPKKPSRTVERALRQIREELRKLSPKRKRVPTFSAFVLQWFESYARRGKKPRTLSVRRYHLRRWLLPVLGKLPLNAIRQPEIEMVRERCTESELFVGTTNQVLSTLNQILAEAEEQEIIDARPRIRLAAVVRPRKPVHEVSTYLRIVRAAKRLGWRYHLCVLLCGDAGLRAGEAAALCWLHIDLEARTIIVAQQDYLGTMILPKGNRARTVRMTTALWRALSAIPERRRRGRVLLGKRGFPIRRATIGKWVDAATSAAGVTIDVGGAHTLRHCYISHLAEARAPITAIQEMAGQCHPNSLRPYLHATRGAVESAVRLLDAKRSKGR